MGRRKVQRRAGSPPSLSSQLLVERLRRAYPRADTVAAVLAPHGYRVLVVSEEFLALCPRDREADLARRLGDWHPPGRIALAFLATPAEEWSDEWPFVNRRRFLDPKVTWRGVA